MKLYRTALLAALVAAAFACNQGNDRGARSGQATTTGAQNQSRAQGTTDPNTGSTTGTGSPGPDYGSVQGAQLQYDVATARIAGARCDRVISCEQIGPDKRFATREMCADDEGRRARSEMNSSQCSNGVDSNRLQACVSALAQQDCSALVASLQQVAACQTAAMCM